MSVLRRVTIHPEPTVAPGGNRPHAYAPRVGVALGSATSGLDPDPIQAVGAPSPTGRMDSAQALVYASRPWLHPPIRKWSVAYR